MTADRKFHCCEYSLLNLIEDWKAALDDKAHEGMLSTDMSNVLDSVQRRLHKLKTYAFSEASLNMMRVFLNNRRNRVGSTTWW